jgi:hypothetical protein
MKKLSLSIILLLVMCSFTMKAGAQGWATLLVTWEGDCVKPDPDCKYRVTYTVTNVSTHTVVQGPVEGTKPCDDENFMRFELEEFCTLYGAAHYFQICVTVEKLDINGDIVCKGEACNRPKQCHEYIDRETRINVVLQ